MHVFWTAGYDGASIPMRTEAMGISAQSLYAAFGSKEALYREAIGFYGATIGGYAARTLENADAVDAVTQLLREAYAYRRDRSHVEGEGWSGGAEEGR